MGEILSKEELMPSLGRLVRGLSILFWGLPLALIIFGLLWIQTITPNGRPHALTEWLRSLNVFPPLAATSFLFYGLLQFGQFQKQERVWQRALERARVVGLINIGLSPFVFWWNRLPFLPFYAFAVAVLMITGLLFLVNLNLVLDRLAAMLPDETLRIETHFFSSMNLYLLSGIVVLLLFTFGLVQMPELPNRVKEVMEATEATRRWIVLLLVLVPVAMTMTLIWKIKEVIVASVFGPQR